MIESPSQNHKVNFCTPHAHTGKSVCPPTNNNNNSAFSINDIFMFLYSMLYVLSTCDD